MSYAAQNAWKLGLFVVLGASALAATLFWLGVRRLNAEVLPAVSYFNESVEGLDVGSPIKIRGVQIGIVNEIGIAPDHRMVEVHMRLNVATLERLGLWPTPVAVEESTTRLGTADLRVQLAASGITGLKFIQADFFDPAAHPLPILEFIAEPNYVPSVPSTLKSLGDALGELAQQLPSTLTKLETLLQSLQSNLQEARIGDLTVLVEKVLQQLQAELATLDLNGLQQEVASVAQNTRAVMDSIEMLAQRVAGAGGSMDAALTSWQTLMNNLDQAVAQANLEETSAMLRVALEEFAAAAGSMQIFGRQAGESSTSLARDLGGLRKLSHSLEVLLDLIERDPAVLLRGRRDLGSHPLEKH